MLELLRNLWGPKVPGVSPQEAYRRHVAEAEPGLILDVRQPVEYGSGTVPGARQIPLTELGRRLQELPRERQILTICRSSHRSPIAARQLQKAGFEVLNVDGGLLAWEEEGLPLER